jgi:hypothetical protein
MRRASNHCRDIRAPFIPELFWKVSTTNKLSNGDNTCVTSDVTPNNRQQQHMLPDGFGQRNDCPHCTLTWERNREMYDLHTMINDREAKNFPNPRKLFQVRGNKAGFGPPQTTKNRKAHSLRPLRGVPE